MGKIKTILRIIGEILSVSMFILALLLIPVGLPLIEFGSVGAQYQVQYSNISVKQCQYATTDVRDISFLGVTSKIDPCTLDTIYYYGYQVRWKTDAKKWLESYLAKEAITPISIETFEGSK